MSSSQIFASQLEGTDSGNLKDLLKNGNATLEFQFQQVDINKVDINEDNLNLSQSQSEKISNSKFPIDGTGDKNSELWASEPTEKTVIGVINEKESYGFGHTDHVEPPFTIETLPSVAAWKKYSSDISHKLTSAHHKMKIHTRARLQIWARIGISAAIPTVVAHIAPVLLAWFELEMSPSTFKLFSPHASEVGSLFGAAFSGLIQYKNNAVNDILKKFPILGFPAMQAAYLLLITSTVWASQYYFFGGTAFVDKAYMGELIPKLLNGAFWSIMTQGPWMVSISLKTAKEMQRMESISEKSREELLAHSQDLTQDELNEEMGQQEEEKYRVMQYIQMVSGTRHFWNSIFNNSLGLVMTFGGGSNMLNGFAFAIGTWGAFEALHHWVDLHPEANLSQKLYGVKNNLSHSVQFTKDHLLNFFRNYVAIQTLSYERREEAFVSKHRPPYFYSSDKTIYKESHPVLNNSVSVCTSLFK